jgi:hypothetical protein
MMLLSKPLAVAAPFMEKLLNNEFLFDKNLIIYQKYAREKTL